MTATEARPYMLWSGPSTGAAAALGLIVPVAGLVCAVAGVVVEWRLGDCEKRR